MSHGQAVQTEHRLLISQSCNSAEGKRYKMVFGRRVERRRATAAARAASEVTARGSGTMAEGASFYGRRIQVVSEAIESRAHDRLQRVHWMSFFPFTFF